MLELARALFEQANYSWEDRAERAVICSSASISYEKSRGIDVSIMQSGGPFIAFGTTDVSERTHEEHC